MNENTKTVLRQLMDQNREAPPGTEVTLAGGGEEEEDQVLPYHAVRGQKDRAETVEFRTLAPAAPPRSPWA